MGNKDLNGNLLSGYSADHLANEYCNEIKSDSVMMRSRSRKVAYTHSFRMLLIIIIIIIIIILTDFRYHAFIIYSHQDSRWMRKQLLPLLEEKHHLTCCIHYKDFIPGKPIRDNMTDSVYTSYKVIALFSQNFINSSCCMYELDVAVNRLVQKRDNSLAIIRIDGADWKRLPAELRGRCFIDYHYPQERPFWGKRLLKFLDLPTEIRRQSTSEEHITDNNNDESNCNDEK